jgi:two-component system NarL family sensor kinase
VHDGPLQTMLAARMELDEVRERIPDPALDMIYAVLNDTAAPSLDGDGAASTGAGSARARAGGSAGTVAPVRDPRRLHHRSHLEEVGRPISQALLYRAARELLANVNKHAGRPR